MSRPLIIGVSLLLALSAYRSAGGQGYSIRGDRVLIDRAAEWRDWSFPADIAEITEEGQVRPRLIRRDIDAVEEVAAFGGGIVAAGSNPEDASNILDGDPETFWEPDLEDPLDNWWVEIDLGRLVSATELTLQFAEEGDPFLLFDVLASDGRKAFFGSELMGYRLVGRTPRSSREQRVFRYELEPVEKATEEWTGAAIQYIWIVVTGSMWDHAEEVTGGEYERLSPEDRGAVRYTVEAFPGEEVSVTREEYEGFPSEKRGPVRYYRREHPRLSEVSVRSEGDNLGPGILDRGGSLDFAGPSAAATNLFDGTYLEEWRARTFQPSLPEKTTLIVDLGAMFWVDTIHVIHSPTWFGGTLPLLGYLFMGSDGARAPDGSLIWTTLTSPSRAHIPAGTGRFRDTFSLRKLRFLLFRNMPPSDLVRINEVQIYGRGYVPEGVLTSGLIELGGSRNLTSIEWKGETPEGTRIEIRTRTGDELDEVKHFFDRQGKEITELRWNGLPGFSRGDVVTERVPGSDWSGWSAPYIASGDEMASPSPRKYAMIEARLLSDVPDRFPELDRITLNFASPVARSVVGEISPERNLTPGRPAEFALFLRPTLLPSNPGFDRIRLVSPPGVEMAFVGLSLGREEDFPERSEETFGLGEQGGFSDSSKNTLQVLGDGTSSVEVVLPDAIKIGDAELIRIRFHSEIFLSGTVFRASIGNSASPDAWQQVDSGDATYLTSSRGMTVSVSLKEEIVGNVEIVPNPFTPNGDGMNDVADIAFTILKLNTPREVAVTIRSLDGRRLRKITQRRSNPSGRYVIPWTGEDEEGRRVPPGLYVCLIQVDADSESDGTTAIQRTICVAY